MTDPIGSLLRCVRARVPPGVRARWPQLRALFIAWHLVAMVAVACPAPPKPLTEATWKRASLKAELKAWTGRLNALGVTMTEAEVKREVTTLTNDWILARRKVVAVPHRYLRVIGAPQGWYMFTGPDRAPQRFMLEATTVDDATPFAIFALGEGVKAPDILAPGMMDDHRVRRAMFQSSWSAVRTFPRVCQHFERKVRAARPDVDDVMCRLQGQPVMHPARLDAERPITTVRQLVRHRDGTETLTTAVPAEERPAGTPRRARPKLKRVTSP